MVLPAARAVAGPVLGVHADRVALLLGEPSKDARKLDALAANAGLIHVDSAPFGSGVSRRRVEVPLTMTQVAERIEILARRQDCIDAHRRLASLAVTDEFDRLLECPRCAHA